MIRGYLAEDGITLHICGSAFDLNLLDKTVIKIMDIMKENNFIKTDMYFQFSKFSENLKMSSRKEIANMEAFSGVPDLHSFETTFAEALVILNLIVTLSDYTVINELDRVNMLFLSHLLRKEAINNYNAQDVVSLKDLIGQKFVFSNLGSFIKAFKFEVFSHGDHPHKSYAAKVNLYVKSKYCI